MSFFKLRFSGLMFVVLTSMSSPLALGKEEKWTHYGVRPMAMGNAYVAVADDFNALFYNPAGLARLKTWSLEVINPRFAISANTIATMKDVSELSSGGSDASAGKSSVQSAIETFETLTGKPQYINLGLTPHFVFPGFGFGIGLDVGGSMVIHRQISAEVNAGLDALVPFTYAKSMLDDRLSLGATVKGVFRTGVDREFSLADISAFAKSDSATGPDSDKQLKDFVQSGRGIGTDFGLLFTPVKTMEPTLGVSLTDAGGTPLSASSDNYGKPKPREPSLNTGISFKPYSSGAMYLLTSVDAHSINQPFHYSKKFNVGSELGLGKIFKIQAGLHQGEFSGGFQLDAWLLILRFATYAEQLGSTAGEDKLLADRRYVVEMKLLL